MVLESRDVTRQPETGLTAQAVPEGSQEVLRVWRYLPIFAVSVTVLSFLIHEIYSLDIWWQIAIGRDILTSGEIPRIDRYAAAAVGRPYHDSHWLFQVVMALAHRLGGWIGVQAVMVGAWATALVLCYRATRAWIGPTAASVLVFLAAMASAERFLPRPEIVTFIGIAAFYEALQQRRYRSFRGVAFLVVLQVLWANSHGLFVIGPFMVGCYWLTSLLQRKRGALASDVAPLSMSLLAVTVASCITPFGLHGWWYSVVLFSEAGRGGPKVMQSLGELSGTFSDASRSSPAFWFYAALLLLALAGLILAIKRRCLSGSLLIVAALCMTSFSGRRNIVLFALAAAPFLAESLSLIQWSRRLQSTRLIPFMVAVLIGAYASYPLSGRYYLDMELPSRTGLGVTPSFFPHHLPSFLDRIQFKGQVLNSNTLGGFYMFHGHPDRVPLTDGRWETYDRDLLDGVVGVSRSNSWEQVAGQFDVTGLLLAHTSPEAAAILPDVAVSPDWRLVYLDLAASFWTRTSVTPASMVIDANDPRSIPLPKRPDDGLILNAFLAQVGEVDRRIDNLKATLEFGVRETFLLEQLGPLLIQAGRLEEARAALERLLVLDPSNETALNELAYLAYIRGDLKSAIEMMDLLMRIDPSNTDYRENYRRLTSGRGAE